MEKMRDQMPKIGNEIQIAGTRHYMLTDGGSYGVRAIDVKTGGGLEYTILTDRGLDISLCSFRGVNLTYISPQGELNPAFYNSIGNEWFRTFFSGLLTTCGPTYFGPECIDEGQNLGVHGRFNATPSVRVCDRTDYLNDLIEITGVIGNFVLFGEKIVAERSISSPIGENIIKIRDIITNQGGSSIPFTLLYHINFGYPLLDDQSVTYVNSSSVEGYDEYSTIHQSQLNSFAKPSAGNLEKNYLHRFKDVKPHGQGCIYNPDLIGGCGVSIQFDIETLPFLTQWKMEGVRDYVQALEPSNAPCLSRSELRSLKLLPFLEPGESVTFEIVLSIIDECTINRSICNE
jgi:hypothetical protein